MIYDLIDRPVASLGNGARFTLWAMRRWATSVEERTCPPIALGPGFESVNALGLLPHFHIAMALLNRHGRDRIALAPVGCRRIVEHEAILLTMWYDLSLGRIEQVRATLVLLVEDSMVEPATRALTLACVGLTAAGFDMDPLLGNPANRTIED